MKWLRNLNKGCYLCELDFVYILNKGRKREMGIYRATEISYRRKGVWNMGMKNEEFESRGFEKNQNFKNKRKRYFSFLFIFI